MRKIGNRILRFPNGFKVTNCDFRRWTILMSQIATSSWPATFKVKKIDLRICEIRRKRAISRKKATWGQKFWLQVEVNLSHVQILHITFSLMILNLSNSREKLSQILRQFNLNYGTVVKISEEKGNLHFLQIANSDKPVKPISRFKVTICDLRKDAIFKVANCDFKHKSWSHKRGLQVGRRLNGTRSRCKICTLESAKFAENERFWAKRQFEVQKLHFKLSGFPTGSDRWRTVKEYLKVQSDRSQTATGSANPILSFVQVPLAQLRKCLFCKRDLQKYGFGGECGMCRFCTYHSLWRNCGQKIWPQNSDNSSKKNDFE